MRQFPSHRLLTPADKAAVDAVLFSQFIGADGGYSKTDAGENRHHDRPSLENRPPRRSDPCGGQGKNRQRGTHDELMKQDGIYRRFISGREQAVGWKLSHI